MATLRQKKLAKRLIENDGESMSEAMRASGYSEGYAHASDKIRKTKGWAELVESILDEQKILKAIDGLIDADAIITIKEKGKGKEAREIRIVKQDAFARSKGIDFALKIKGKYAPTKLIIEDPNENLTDDELEKKIEELKTIKKRYDIASKKTALPAPAQPTIEDTTKKK